MTGLKTRLEDVYSFVSRSRLVIALILIAAAARTVFLTWLHPLNWDEIEFFRATDWMHQGLVPYRDFFEHHTPLQWFLFAPDAALTRSPAAAAIIAMRWAQIPLWACTFWLLSRWMRHAGVGLLARLSVILLALCSSMFMLSAMEYRVDTVGCLLYFVALLLLQRVDGSAWLGFAAGGALCLAAFANLRLDPLLVLTILLAWLLRRSAANAVLAGAVVTFALCSIYFVATHSASIAFRRTLIDNYVDTVSGNTRSLFLARLAAPFGFDLFDSGHPRFDVATLDLATIVTLILGTIGVVRVVAGRWRTPDSLFFLALLQMFSVLIVAAMRFIYSYHFEIVLLMMLPFVGAEIDRFLKKDRRWSVVAVGLILISAMNLFASIFRGNEGDLGYQDRIMRETDARTPRASKVFDGVGWALRRRPAYRYWFLPAMIMNLDAAGKIESYTDKEMAADPPAAIISDYRTYRWLASHRELAAFAVSHYLPLWRNLWLPAMSRELTPAERWAEWIVPESGTYRIYGSARLAFHPWFRAPLLLGTFESHGAEIALTRFPSANRLPLAWSVDGVPMIPSDRLPLRRGQRLRVELHAAEPIGIMIVPASVTDLFRQPPHGVTLDGVAPVTTHVPEFPSLFR